MNISTTSPPPEPPDISSMHLDPAPTPSKEQHTATQLPLTFAQTLLTNNQFTYYPNTCNQTHSHIDLTDETTNDLHRDTFIPLTSADKSRLYLPWKFSVIVKVYGRKVGHQTLWAKLTALWKPTEELPLIDLGCDFYLVMFQKEENMLTALYNGPWFILNHFLSVRK